MEIVSNISYIKRDLLISCTFESNNEPRKILKSKLAELRAMHDAQMLIIIAMRCAGRRVISAENCKLLNGRRHRIYYGIMLNKKQKIGFVWHKIKHLSQHELDFMQKNWHSDFFETNSEINGKFLIKQSAGAVLEHLVYQVTGQFFL